MAAEYSDASPVMPGEDEPLPGRMIGDLVMGTLLKTAKRWLEDADDQPGD